MINRTIILGRLTRDPELKQANNGNAVCTFTLAIDSGQKDSEGKKGACFFNVVVFNNQRAESVSKFARKGMLVAVEGKLNQRNYVRADGLKISVVEIIANAVQFLSRKDPNPDEIEMPVFDDDLNLDDNAEQDEIVKNTEAEGINLSDDGEF